MNDKSRIFLVQQPPPTYRRGHPPVTKDLSSAQKYGTIIPVLAEGEQPSSTPAACMNRIYDVVNTFDEKTDYVCFAGGDPMSLALTLLVLADIGVESAKVLRWERERNFEGSRTGGGFYLPVETPLVL